MGKPLKIDDWVRIPALENSEGKIKDIVVDSNGVPIFTVDLDNNVTVICRFSEIERVGWDQ